MLKIQLVYSPVYHPRIIPYETEKIEGIKSTPTLAKIDTISRKHLSIEGERSWLALRNCNLELSRYGIARGSKAIDGADSFMAMLLQNRDVIYFLSNFLSLYNPNWLL